MQEFNLIRFQQGDKGSYRLLFDFLYPSMCLFAHKFINDYDDAEDITQEIFIALWHHRTRFKDLDHIKSFLYLSIRNKCLNLKKHRLIRKNYAENFPADNEYSFEENIIETDVIQNLNTAIESLPGQQKQVILQSIQGHTNDEIAENMQISPNTVRYHKKAAYKLLREKLRSSSLILAVLL